MCPTLWSFGLFILNISLQQQGTLTLFEWQTSFKIIAILFLLLIYFAFGLFKPFSELSKFRKSTFCCEDHSNIDDNRMRHKIDNLYWTLSMFNRLSLALFCCREKIIVEIKKKSHNRTIKIAQSQNRSQSIDRHYKLAFVHRDEYIIIQTTLPSEKYDNKRGNNNRSS